MDQIEELLTRGVDKIYPSKAALEKVLRNGKKLTLYQGFDPTGDRLHIGHMVGLIKLADWQRLGHKVIFLIGDGTGQAGDPSGKTKSRDTFFNQAELRKNAKDYVMQASKIVKFDGENPIEIKYNGDWLNRLALTDILDIANHFSVQQLIERDMFQVRIKNNEQINLREFLYPILQGYDSVAMNVDLEVGGSDQTFNMLQGRKLQREYNDREKFVLTTPLLADASGRKIGKTEGNAIAITDKPEELFGKIMAFPDEVIISAFECLTRIPMDEVTAMKHAIKEGENPMLFKKTLATAIVSMLNTKERAEKAAEVFERTVQNRELPSEVLEVKLSGDDPEAVNEDLLVALNLAGSRSEAKRLFQQGGVAVDDGRVKLDDQVSIRDGMILKVGKRKIVRLKKP